MPKMCVVLDYDCKLVHNSVRTARLPKVLKQNCSNQGNFPVGCIALEWIQTVYCDWRKWIVTCLSLKDVVSSGNCKARAQELLIYGKNLLSQNCRAQVRVERCSTEVRVLGIWVMYMCSLTSIATWLILPVVICLSQRLSHACLSIAGNSEAANSSLQQPLFLGSTLYLDNCGNSRANTCNKLRRKDERIY